MDSDKVTETPPVRNIPEYLRRIACLKRGLDAEQGGARAIMMLFRGSEQTHSWELESSC